MLDPARHAYSHWASVGKAYFLPSLSLSQSQNTLASFQLAQTTGWSSLCSKPGFCQLASGTFFQMPSGKGRQAP